MSKLLINEQPLQVLPSLAKLIGLNEAIIIQQLHYWLNVSKNERDGHKWVYNTYEDWAKQFPFWSVSTIRRAINNLEQKGLLITTDEYNKMPIDKTKWYRIDYEKLTDEIGEDTTAQNEQSADATAQNEQPRLSKVSSPVVQNEQMSLSKMDTPITRENTEKTTEKEPEKESSATVFALYADNIGELKPLVADNLGDLLDEHGEQWVREAIEVSVERNKRSLAYIIATLKACKKEGHSPKAPISLEKKIAKKFDIPDDYADQPDPTPAPPRPTFPGDPIWQTAYGELQLQLPRETFNTWLRNARLVDQEGDTYIVGVDNLHAREWLDTRLRDVVVKALRRIADKEIAVEFVVIDEYEAKDKPKEEIAA